MENNICPRCRKNPLTKHPALSRLDNKTPVCPTCGMGEALEAMTNNGFVTNFLEPTYSDKDIPPGGSSK